MNSQNPIVYVLGVEGHFYLSQALKDKFQRPVVGIATTQRFLEMMTDERRAIFDEIYSLPDFYFENIGVIKAYSDAELNQQCMTLEQRLGVTKTPYFSQIDRRISAMSDYRSAREWQLCNLMFIEYFLNEVQPAFVLDGVVTYLQLALRQACEQSDVPYLLSMGSRNNGVTYCHANGQIVGMAETLKKIKSGETQGLDQQRLEEADALFDGFVSKPERPAYAIRNSRTKFNLQKFLKRFFMAINVQKLFPSRRVCGFDLALKFEYRPWHIFGRFIVMQIRKAVQKFRGYLNDAPDFEANFLYVPLHYTPEVSDLYFGSAYDHHEAFIRRLAKYVPSGTQLYVKEHTSMVGRRPNSFYRNLNALHNVQVISPDLSTFKMIEHARATLTVTGTAGWEAFLLGKPSIVLGDVFFNGADEILNTEINAQFTALFERYLDNFQSSESSRRDVFRAYYLRTYSGQKVDIGFSSSTEKAVEDARMFSEGLADTISKFHKEMQGNFDSIINTNKPALQKAV